MGGNAKVVKKAVAPARRKGSFLENRANEGLRESRNILISLVFDLMGDMNGKDTSMPESWLL